MQFTTHQGPRNLLLSTASQGTGMLELVEISPNDFFWGRGVDGSGQNHLGRLLMALRKALLEAHEAPEITSHRLEKHHAVQLAGR